MLRYIYAIRNVYVQNNNNTEELSSVGFETCNFT